MKTWIAAGVLMCVALTGSLVDGQEIGSNAVVIFPPSGTYVTSQGFDLLLMLAAPGVGVVGGSAFLDSTNVAAALAGCVAPGTLVTGGQTFRCRGLRGSTLGPGTHTFSVTLNLSDGSSVSQSVTWTVLADTAP